MKRPPLLTGLADHPFTSRGVRVPGRAAKRRVQEIIRAVLNEPVLVRRGSSPEPERQSDPADLPE